MCLGSCCCFCPPKRRFLLSVPSVGIGIIWSSILCAPIRSKKFPAQLICSAVPAQTARAHRFCSSCSTSVDFSRARYTTSTDAGLWAVFSRLPNLHRLRIGASYRLTEIGVSRVLNFASEFSRAHDRLKFVTEAADLGFPLPRSALSDIAERGFLNKLVHLELNIAPSARIDGLTSLLSLKIQPPVPVSFNTYKTIRRTPLKLDMPNFPPSLREVRLIDCIARQHAFLPDLQQQCPDLVLLDLSESHLDFRDDPIHLFLSLKSLILDRAHIDNIPRTLHLPASLQSLSAAQWTRKDFPMQFSQCPLLETLRLSGFAVWTPWTGYPHRARFPSLPYEHLQSLRKLDVSHCNLFDDQAHEIAASLPNLNELDISGNDKLSATAASNIKLLFNHISLVNLRVVPVHDHGIVPVTHVESTQRIPCSDCGLLVAACCEEDHQHVCYTFRRPCPFAASGCSIKTTSRELSLHLRECSFYLVICPRCQEVFPRRDFEYHSRFHDKTSVAVKQPCPMMEFGCIGTWPDSKGERHNCVHAEVECPACSSSFPNASKLSEHVCPSAANQDARYRLLLRTEEDKQRFGHSRYSYYGSAFVEDGE